MAFIISTGLRNHMLVTGSIKAALDGSVLRIFNGSVPASADADCSASTLLCEISVGGTGTGLSFDATPTNGVIVKNTTEVWSGTVLENGTATFYRLCPVGDTNVSSSTQKRAQGTVGTLMADLLVSSTTFVQNNERVVDSFAIGMPSA